MSVRARLNKEETLSQFLFFFSHSLQEGDKKLEYRVWNPFRSKLAAAIVGGIKDIWVKPGSKLLYLGAASGTTVSHCSDLVGPEGLVYAVEFSNRSGRDLIGVAKNRKIDFKSPPPPPPPPP